jgi:hypothetical protein
MITYGFMIKKHRRAQLFRRCHRKKGIVPYCSEHYGDDNVEDIITQILPESFKDQIAELMRMGVPHGCAFVDLRAAAWRLYNCGNNSNK